MILYLFVSISFDFFLFILEICSSQGSDYEPQSKKSKFQTIPLLTKIRICNLAREHPKWSLKTLQNNGASCLSRKDELKRWSVEIKSGGTKFDKLQFIKEYASFCLNLLIFITKNKHTIFNQLFFLGKYLKLFVKNVQETLQLLPEI